MKKILSLVAALNVVGCAAQTHAPVSTNTDRLVIGTKPEGYPRTHIEPDQNVAGLCLEVTENWRQEDYKGKTIWLKDDKVKTVNCTPQ